MRRPGCRAQGVLSQDGAIQTPFSERSPMSDKSPRQGMTKKTGKSIKEKRAEKRDQNSGNEVLGTKKK